VKYVIARNFPVAGDRVLSYGDVADPEEVESWPNLQALISSHYIYPIADDDEAPWLPPHLYSYVANLQVAAGIIAQGEQPNMTVDWTKSPQVEQQEALLDMEKESRERNAVVAEVRARRSFAEFQVTQVSPRPIELPPEKVFVDSKHEEALGTGVEHIEVPEEDVDLPEPADQEEEDLAEAPDADEVGKTGYKPDEVHPVEVEHGADFPEGEDDYTKADLVELAKSWNEAHEDDKISVYQNKADLEADLKDRGAL
jgi:hypothetical protein